ncbi:hypothetical protein MEBOL_003217 [Melittangium boletus DSM 14713]|uniref:Uncharacterized protein n=2 Tax=Melittangium boletus TaxID=83453 RepID=A0A250IF26_9BACT|nr:hypothetical protein MEBOL_003217 [Melittangium boletus DSM 14713]
MGSWYSFRDKLSEALPNFITGETGSTSDGALRCIVYPPEAARVPTSNWIVVGCVSILAPVYFVYGVECDYADGRLQNPRASFERPPSSMDFPAQMVARTIEMAFGYSAVPRDIAETPVPLFAGLLEPPKTTLFHALFTNEPSSIP